MNQTKCPTQHKVCHPTKAEAKKHLHHLVRNTFNSRTLHVYRCPDWKLHPALPFHVGHIPGRRTKGWKLGRL